VGIVINVIDDILDEDDENVVITMGTPTNATKGSPDVHTATITDNDDPPLVSFDLASQSGPEGVGTMIVKAELENASSKDVTVSFGLSGTATPGAGNDYTITSSPVTIPAGATYVDIVISVYEDGIPEPDETIILTMGTPTNGTLGSPSVHTSTITYSGGQPTVSFIKESDFVVRAELDSVWSNDVVVPFTLSDSTAKRVLDPPQNSKSLI